MVLRPTGRGRVGHRRNTRPPPHTSHPTKGRGLHQEPPPLFRVWTRFSATSEIGVSTSAGGPLVGACLLLEWRRRVGARSGGSSGLRRRCPALGAAGAPRNGVRAGQSSACVVLGEAAVTADVALPSSAMVASRAFSPREELGEIGGLTDGRPRTKDRTICRHRETGLSAAEANRGGGARSGAFSTATCSAASCARAPGVVARPRRRCCGATRGLGRTAWSPPPDATSTIPISTSDGPAGGGRRMGEASTTAGYRRATSESRPGSGRVLRPGVVDLAGLLTAWAALTGGWGNGG